MVVPTVVGWFGKSTQACFEFPQHPCAPLDRTCSESVRGLTTPLATLRVGDRPRFLPPTDQMGPCHVVLGRFSRAHPPACLTHSRPLLFDVSMRAHTGCLIEARQQTSLGDLRECHCLLRGTTATPHHILSSSLATSVSTPTNQLTRCAVPTTLCHPDHCRTDAPPTALSFHHLVHRSTSSKRLLQTLGAMKQTMGCPSSSTTAPGR